MIDKVMKRDGRFANFDQERIANAIFKAALSVGGGRTGILHRLSQSKFAVN